MKSACQNPPISKEAHTTSGKLATRKVRVNVTAKDLLDFRQNMGVMSYARERKNPVAAAINRTLRDGYAATFDGLSVGIICTSTPSSMGDSHQHVEYPSDGSVTRWARLTERKGQNDQFESTAFYRGVSKPVQQLHKLCVARRAKTGGRFTLSLPEVCLKRVETADLAPVYDGQ